MAKTPTTWVENPTKYAGVLTYNDASTTYSSAGQRYVSATNNENEQNKTQTSWSVLTKTATGWVFNPNFATNQYPYDSGTFKYDSSTMNYDGITSGQSPVGTKSATSWTQVG